MDKRVEKRVFHDIDKWKQKIESFGEPQDDFERTRFHFLCTQGYVTSYKSLIRNVAALFLTPIAYIYYFIRNFRARKEIKCDGLIHVPFQYTTFDCQKLPETLKEEYLDVKNSGVERKSIKSGRMDSAARYIWIQMVKKYPLCFYMNFYNLYQLANLSELLSVYCPRAVITEREENNPAASLLTHYCEDKNIEYICVMHGECFYEPFHAFVRFSRLYVWDRFYIDQFKLLKSAARFETYYPLRFQMKIARESRPEYFAAYYLQNQTQAEMRKICQVLEHFAEKGLRCKVRPHKRATDVAVVKKVFSGTVIEIEDNDAVPIEESYCNAKYIISTFSTVLSEAYENGLEPVIDDISNPELYESLCKAMYINIARIQARLSDLVRKE